MENTTTDRIVYAYKDVEILEGLSKAENVSVAKTYVVAKEVYKVLLVFNISVYPYFIDLYASEICVEEIQVRIYPSQVYVDFHRANVYGDLTSGNV